MRCVPAAWAVVALVGCQPARMREPPSDPAPATAGRAAPARALPREDPPLVTVGAGGLPVGDPGGEPGLHGVLGDQAVQFRNIRLVYTANRHVELRAEHGDARLLLPIVLDPAESRCVERPLGLGIGSGRLALDLERFSARFAYRLRVREMERRPYDHRAPASLEGQRVGSLSGDLIAVFQAGPYSPLGGWVAGNLTQIPVVQRGDSGRERQCTPGNQTGPLEGRFKGEAMDFRAVELSYFPQSDDSYPAGYELRLAAIRKAPRLRLRFESVPGAGSCTELRSTHEGDPGERGGDVPRFRLEISRYVAATKDKPGSVSGHVRAEFRPDTTVEGAFEDVPVVVHAGPSGPRRCRMAK
jgi:hypothetical protein